MTKEVLHGSSVNVVASIKKQTNFKKMTYLGAHLKLLMYLLAINDRTRPSKKKFKHCKSAVTPASVFVRSVCQKSIPCNAELFKRTNTCCEKCNV